jgi:thioredoxin-like negative regulator of GroEL
VVEGIANVALAVGDFAMAEAAFREALTREPGSGRAYFGLADALAAERKPDEARTVRDKAAKAWDKADADLPQIVKLRTATAADRR